jgi:hypothetical protein
MRNHQVRQGNGRLLVNKDLPVTTSSSNRVIPGEASMRKNRDDRRRSTLAHLVKSSSLLLYVEHDLRFVVSIGKRDEVQTIPVR